MEKFLEKIPVFKKAILLLSSQSRASLARHLNLQENEVHFLLSSFFSQFNVSAVLDLEVFISLVKKWELEQFRTSTGMLGLTRWMFWVLETSKLDVWENINTQIQ